MLEIGSGIMISVMNVYKLSGNGLNHIYTKIYPQLTQKKIVQIAIKKKAG